MHSFQTMFAVPKIQKKKKKHIESDDDDDDIK